MKKPPSPKSSKKNGTGAHPLPPNLSREVAQAVLEDAVMEAAADIAALSVTLDAATAPPLVATITPETPEEREILELISVPFLGPTRARALADAGIKTLDDLHAATPAQIGSVKGVGLRNAERIKEWLGTRIAAVSPGLPPAPPSLPSASPLSGSPDPALATANQTIFDELGEIDQAIARLRVVMGAKKGAKKLGSQFDKLSTVASELAEGPDTLTAKQLKQALKLLDDIVCILRKASEKKTLSQKKQGALCEALASSAAKPCSACSGIDARCSTASSATSTAISRRCKPSGRRSTALGLTDGRPVLNAGDNVGYGDSPEACVLFLAGAPGDFDGAGQLRQERGLLPRTGGRVSPQVGPRPARQVRSPAPRQRRHFPRHARLAARPAPRAGVHSGRLCAFS